MELNELLDVMDRATANLAKLEQVWLRAAPMIPDGPIYLTTATEYEDPARDWHDLLHGLPPIDGWRITVELPDPAAIGVGGQSHGARAQSVQARVSRTSNS